MRFTTISGSVYEVNTDSKQIRRLNGTQDPTPRQGKDGQWRAYDEIAPNPPKVGASVAIKWAGDVDLTEEGKAFVVDNPGGFAMPLTVTSMLVSVEP